MVCDKCIAGKGKPGNSFAGIGKKKTKCGLRPHAPPQLGGEGGGNMFVKKPMFFLGGFFFEKEPPRKWVSLRGIDQERK